MAKAFDMLSHGFVREVLKFFNFGPNLIRWLTLLGENRSASIIIDDGVYSRPFELGRGRAQGDNISPNTFNFAEQILLFKIELDSGIASIGRHRNIPIDFPVNNDPFFMHEARGETSKNESLADDNTTITKYEEQSLLRLREVLVDFACISGLHCNFDKTMVMPVGSAVHNKQRLGDFTVTNQITLLGLDINNNLDNVEDIFMKIANKINNLIQFWNRFRLSLPGRIAILKTFLLPQINYIGCFLTPSDYMINGLQTLMDDLILGSLNISRDRRYLPPELGGIGIVQVSTFLMAQQCSWIKRTFDGVIDNWRLDLTLATPQGKIELVRSCDINRECNPILFNLVRSFEYFVSCFSHLEQNYKKAHVFRNFAFKRSKADGRLLDENFFGKNFYEKNREIIRQLTFENCFSGNDFKTVAEFVQMGLPLPVGVWMRLRSALLLSKKKFSHEDIIETPSNKSLTVRDFLSKFRHGSKKFRTVIEKSEPHCSNPSELSVVNTFATVTSTMLPSSSTLKFNLGYWSKHYIENDFRTFLFKSRHNILGVGSRISHWISTVTDSCVLCRVSGLINPQKETYNHLFFSCAVTNSLLFNLMRRYKMNWNLDNSSFKQLFRYGENNGVLEKETILFFDCFRYCLWKLRSNRKAPTLSAIVDSISHVISNIFALKPAIRVAFQRNNNLVEFLGAIAER